MRRTLLLISVIICLFSCKSHPSLPTVSNVDLKQYMGKWYEVAKLPNSFEKGLVCITAEYQLTKDGNVEVFNRGRDIKNTSIKKSARAVAVLPDKKRPGELKVSFFRPFYGNYYIIALDSNYQYSLVGDPSRKYLWVLSRNRSLDPLVYDRLLEIAKSKGFDISKVEKTNQECEDL